MAKPPGFEFVAGHVALEFVNTVDWRLDAARRHELIRSFDDLLTWANLAGLVDASRIRESRTAAQRDPAGAERSLRRARRLREALFRIMSAARHDDPPTPRDLRLFNAFLTTALRKRRIDVHRNGWSWSWTRNGDDAFDSILWPVVLAAADLLTSPARTQIGECAGEGCGWLFLDTSRTARRRWCTMRGCGNRAKVRRFYHRSRAST
ncbi:MAG TPA: ABATE domain-containing protein [Vicinamibacterales bacterium]|jgi:predicted RNA-binding Zn ribbon-like protein